jgi:hypothetical protein
MHRFGRVLALMGLVAVVAAGCSSDDGGSSGGTSTTLQGDRTAFCTAIQQYLDTADFSEEATSAAYTQFLELAPQQIRRAVSTIVDAQGGTAVPAEELTRANDRFTAYVEQGCGVALSSS